jgi:hypothetical protein
MTTGKATRESEGDVGFELPKDSIVARFAPISLRAAFVRTGAAPIDRFMEWRGNAKRLEVTSLPAAFEVMEAIVQGSTCTVFARTRQPDHIAVFDNRLFEAPSLPPTVGDSISFECRPAIAGDGHWWSGSFGRVMFQQQVFPNADPHAQPVKHNRVARRDEYAYFARYGVPEVIEVWSTDAAPSQRELAQAVDALDAYLEQSRRGGDERADGTADSVEEKLGFAYHHKLREVAFRVEGDPIDQG